MKQTEKRYFKVYTSKYKENSLYINLFNAIDKQAKQEDFYNEKKLLTLFKNDVDLKNFAMAKKYLYKRILRKMRAYYADSADKDELLRELICNIRYLISLSLFDQAIKMLTNAHKIADHHERFIEKLSLIRIERSLIAYGVFNETIKKSQRRLYQLEADTIRCIKETSDYENIANLIYEESLNFEKSNSKAALNNMKILMTNSLLKNENLPTLYSSKRFYYHAKAIYYRVTNDHEQGFFNQQKRFELFKRYPQFIHPELRNYIAVLYNLLSSCVGIGNQQEFKYYLTCLRSVTSKNKTIQCAVFSHSYDMELYQHIVCGNLKDALQLIPPIEKGLKIYAGIMDRIREESIMYYIIFLYFQLGNYKKTSLWINKILSPSKDNEQSHIPSFVRIIKLFVYYELEEVLLLPYLLKSTQLYFSKKGSISEIEKLSIATIKLLLKNTKKQEEKNIYTSFYENLNKTRRIKSKQSIEKTILCFWLTNQILNKP